MKTDGADKRRATEDHALDSPEQYRFTAALLQNRERLTRNKIMADHDKKRKEHQIIYTHKSIELVASNAGALSSDVSGGRCVLS